MVRNYKLIKKGISILAENKLNETEISKITYLREGKNSSDRSSVRYLLQQINKKEDKHNLSRLASKITEHITLIGICILVLTILVVIISQFFINNPKINFSVLILQPIFIFLISLVLKVKKTKVKIDEFVWLNVSNILLLYASIKFVIDSIYDGQNIEYLFILLVIIILTLFSIGGLILGFKKSSMFSALILFLLLYIGTFSFVYPSGQTVRDQLKMEYLKKDDSINLTFVSSVTNFISTKKQELYLNIGLNNNLENNNFIIELNTNRNISKIYFGYNTSTNFNLNKVNTTRANITLNYLGHYKIFYKIYTEGVIPKGDFEFHLGTNRPQTTKFSPLQLGFYINEIFYKCDYNCISDVYGSINFTKYENSAQSLPRPTGLSSPLRISAIKYDTLLPTESYAIRINTTSNLIPIFQVILLALITGMIILFLRKIYEEY